MKLDIGSESRFLPNPPAFEAPVIEVAVGISPWRLVYKQNRMFQLPDGKKSEDMMTHFDRIDERDGRTDGRTDTAWRHRPRLCIASRGKRIQWHVIPESHITLQGAATWWIHCHDFRATCHIVGCSYLAKSMSWSFHIAGCKNSIRHIGNRFSHFFVFNAV